jgi:hypothetical protein
MSAGVVTLLMVLGVLAAASPAQAQPVSSGTLSLSGDPGDYITGGGSYYYDTAAGDVLDVSNTNNETVSINVSGVTGDWWSLAFDAPTGQTLTAGTTYTATRYPFNGAGAGLDLSGNGRGCNTLTGTFTIVTASFGDNGYVQTFDATFQQHCEGFEAAARGEVHIANPPPPAPLTIGVAVAPTGTVSAVSGNAVVSGTVTCSESVIIHLYVAVTQVVKKQIVRGSNGAGGVGISCTPNGPVSWNMTVAPIGTTPFTKGDAEVTANAQAYDDTYNRYVNASTTTVVRLAKA